MTHSPDFGAESRRRKSAPTSGLCVIPMWYQIFLVPDSVPHHRLIFKLTTYNINTELVTWVTDFLRNRNQHVMYINDLPETCAAEDPSSEIYLYVLWNLGKPSKIWLTVSPRQNIPAV